MWLENIICGTFGIGVKYLYSSLTLNMIINILLKNIILKNKQYLLEILYLKMERFLVFKLFQGSFCLTGKFSILHIFNQEP